MHTTDDIAIAHAKAVGHGNAYADRDGDTFADSNAADAGRPVSTSGAGL